jgi:YegS/Rv2252/BmrU family lipid kinase
MTPQGSQDSPPVHNILLLANPHAGSTDQEAIDAASAVWQQAGSTVTHRATSEIEAWDEDASPAPYDLVVLAGGDGTIHRVVSTLATREMLSEITLAVLPLGTGNDFARSMGLPTDPEAAARVVLDGVRRPVDVLRTDRGEFAVNAAHVGLGALASERAHAVKGLLGPLGYLVGAVLAGASMTDYPVRVAVDGEDVTEDGQRVLMLGLSVGRTIGGGAPLAPEASVDDGLIDVVLVHATGPVERVAFARSLLNGTHLDRDDVRLLRGSDVVVHAGDAPLNVDGELLGQAGSRSWAVVPGAWTIVAPR